MNLAKLVFFSCPVILASLVWLNSPAEASTSTQLTSITRTAFTTTHHVVMVAASAPSDRPQLPTGCSCARCTKAEELLQGKLPVF